MFGQDYGEMAAKVQQLTVASQKMRFLVKSVGTIRLRLF
jgi:hypothetical protein